MAINTFKMVAVSNWSLYRAFHGTGRIEDYIEYLARLISAGAKYFPGMEKPDILILREKDMPEPLYLEFFQKVWEKSQAYAAPGQRPAVIPHTYLSAARQMGAGRIHISFPFLLECKETGALEGLREIGVSIHSPQEALEAQELGASYLTAGHIFATDCKKGLPPRGIPFLEEVCGCVRIPVYAIGGISKENLPLVQSTKAQGACMMSKYMKMVDFHGK